MRKPATRSPTSVFAVSIKIAVSMPAWRSFLANIEAIYLTSTTTGSTSSCLESTNVTRGPYFIDNASDPNISGDVVDSSITERSDIRSDTKGSAGTQAGLPLDLTITVGTYSASGTCANISGAQVHIWHCNAQGIYSDV